MIRLFAKSSMVGLPAFRSLENVRFISQTGRILEKATSSTPAETPASQSASGSPLKPTKKRALTNFDKRVLVSTGKYKTVDEVPEDVAYVNQIYFSRYSLLKMKILLINWFICRHETLDRARDKWRVKMCIYMMVACTFICLIQIFRGKKAAERGESVVKSNMEWHRQYNEAASKKENQSKP